ncbi:MAG: DUF1573 domain-containing protein [Pirellulales bacterium]
MLGCRVVFLGLTASCLSIFSCITAWASDPPILTARIFEVSVGALAARFDLGTLPAGKQEDFRLILQNRGDQKIEFTKVKVACSCISAKASSGVIEPNGEIEINLQLTTPTKVVSPLQSMVIFLEEAPGSGVEVRLTFRISGLVTFVDRTFVHSVGVDKEFSVFRIPILVTSPVKVGDLTISTEDALQALKMKIVQGEDTFVECTFDSKRVIGSGLAGVIRVEDPKSGMKSEIHCIIEKEPPLSIFPSVITFNSSKSADETVVWEASALVRIGNAKLKTGLDPNVELTAKFDSESVIKSVKKIGTGTYRVRIEVPAQENLLPQMPPIEWRAEFLGNHYTYSTKVRFNFEGEQR